MTMKQVVCLFVAVATLSVTSVAYSEGWSEAGNSLPPEPTADQARDPWTWERIKINEIAPSKTPSDSKKKGKKKRKASSYPTFRSLEMHEGLEAGGFEAEDLSDYPAFLQDSDFYTPHPGIRLGKMEFFECEMLLSREI